MTRANGTVIREGTATPESTAIITDIQKYSVHDGPGIRTVVFFKGCPLHCIWCQNPETQDDKARLMINPDLCIGCGDCLKACPHHAVRMKDELLVTDRILCVSCGTCAETCHSGARVVAGRRRYTVEEVTEIVMADSVFYKNSGGGVTLSGGEVASHIPFAVRLLRHLKDFGVHTAIETCGQCAWGEFAALLESTDLVLYDIKHMNSGLHKHYTGLGNELILDNLRRARRLGKKVVLRVPFIPGVNADRENLGKIADIARETGVVDIHLLGFHQLGESKWNHLAMRYQCALYQSPSEKILEDAACFFESRALHVNIGGTCGYGVS
jgi:pyruvate formate lyase activating enzyme